MGVLENCPNIEERFSMVEPVANSNPDCYVNPFVMQGAYSKYLQPWLRAFPPERLLVLSHAALEEDAQGTMATVTKFLGLEDFSYDVGIVYNTKFNRGVHTGEGHAVGGVANAISKEDV